MTSSASASDRSRNNGQAIAAIVLGALGIVAMFVLPGIGLFLSLVLGIVAVVLGVKASRAASAAGGANKGKAVTGIVLGGIATALSLLFLVLAAIGIAILTGTDEGQEILEDAQQQSAPAVTATV